MKRDHVVHEDGEFENEDFEIYETYDHYFERDNECRLPSDSVMNDPDELAKLSGPCITIQTKKEKDK